MSVRRLETIFTDVLFPVDTTCCICGAEARVDGHNICAECYAKLRYAGKLPALQYTDGCAAGLVYNDAVKPAVYRFKYGGLWYMADTFAYFIKIPGQWRADALIPVPLYPARERERGYNQSEKLAQSLSRIYGIPVQPQLLKRISDTKTQTELSAQQRGNNVKNAFAAEPCDGMTLILVDDVRTTGSTLNECSRCLKNAGAKTVYAVSAFFSD